MIEKISGLRRQQTQRAYPQDDGRVNKYDRKVGYVIGCRATS